MVMVVIMVMGTATSTLLAVISPLSYKGNQFASAYSPRCAMRADKLKAPPGALSRFWQQLLCPGAYMIGPVI